MTKAMMKVLSKDEIGLLHQSSLRILSEVGVKIDSPSVVELLRKAGAKTDKERGLVRLDERIVLQSLKSAP
ncbi:MAG: trimethylamine methyltransferase family protein, partial [Thermoplasmata archaeon]